MIALSTDLFALKMFKLLLRTSGDFEVVAAAIGLMSVMVKNVPKSSLPTLLAVYLPPPGVLSLLVGPGGERFI